MKHALWELSEEIIGACIAVHREIGPGLLEAVYEECLCEELSQRGIQHERQIPVAVSYKGRPLGSQLRADLVVDGRLLVEIKATESLLPIHLAQVISYLRLMHLDVGLLVNFNVPVLRDGLRRLRRT